MAIEDEFGFEIPDGHGEKLLTPQQIARKGSPLVSIVLLFSGTYNVYANFKNNIC
jgi:hypothetical protein